MNVYVLQLAREFARRGREVDVFTRYHDPDDPKIVDIEPGARVIHLEAGPHDAAKGDLYDYIPGFVTELLDFQRAEEAEYDLIHSHYWLSGRGGNGPEPRVGASRTSPRSTRSQRPRCKRARENGSPSFGRMSKSW